MYLVGLLQCVDEGLEASKVSDQFEDPQNPHDADKPNYFASFADYFIVLNCDRSFRMCTL